MKSTQAAETLAMVDLAEACIFYREFLCDLLHIRKCPTVFPVLCRTDNNGLYQASHSSTQILDKRLRIELGIIREMLSKQEITDVQWVSTDRQLADTLTKRGVQSFKVLKHLVGPKNALA